MEPLAEEFHHLAAGEDEARLWLFQNGVPTLDPDFRRPGDSYSALHVACAEGNIPVIFFLWKCGHSMQATTPADDSWTPPMLAWQNGHLEAVRALVRAGSPLTVSNVRGTTGIMLAAAGGHMELLKWAREVGGDSVLAIRNLRRCTVASWASKSAGCLVLDYLEQLGLDELFEEVNADGNTTIAFAASLGRLDQVKWLYERGCKLHYLNNSGSSPIIEAAKGGYTEVVEFMVSKGVDFRTRSSGSAVLAVAITNGHLETAKAVIAHYPSKDEWVAETNREGENALGIAARWNRIDIVRYLIQEQGISPINFSPQITVLGSTHAKQTSAAIAAGKGHLELLLYFQRISLLPPSRLFLYCEDPWEVQLNTIEEAPIIDAPSMATDMETSSSFSYSPDSTSLPPDCPIATNELLAIKGTRAFPAVMETLMTAVRRDAVSVVRWFACEFGSEILSTREPPSNSTYGMPVRSSLEMALKYESINVAKWLVKDCQVKLPTNTSHGVPWALEVAGLGNMELLKLVLEDLGMDAHIVDPDRGTCFMTACALGCLDIAKYLFYEQKCDIAATNGIGATAAVWTAQKGHTDVLEFLLQIGSPFRHPHLGLTPMTCAAYVGCMKSLKWLYRHGFSLHEHDGFGRRPLHQALAEGQVKAARWIMRKGVSPLEYTISNFSYRHIHHSCLELVEKSWFDRSA